MLVNKNLIIKLSVYRYRYVGIFAMFKEYLLLSINPALGSGIFSSETG